MGSNTFILFDDLQEPIMLLSDEEAGKLFKGIFQYRNGGLREELVGATHIAFMFIKLQLDRSEDHYEMICERNRINGAKGGRPPKNPDNPVGFLGTQHNPDEPNITLPDPKPESDPDPKPKKKKKNIYGEYNHVRLTEDEYESLSEKVFDREELIKRLDEYIETTGKSYKNHSLVIQNWDKKETGNRKVSDYTKMLLED